jgi:competence CoiA-like predicted nuclease
MACLTGLFNNNILHINQYNRHIHANNVKCRSCDNILIAKKGKIVIHHYAHGIGSECTIKRDSDNKSPWHLLFQNIVKPYYLERPIIKYDKKTHSRCNKYE